MAAAAEAESARTEALAAQRMKAGDTLRAKSLKAKADKDEALAAKEGAKPAAKPKAKAPPRKAKPKAKAPKRVRQEEESGGDPTSKRARSEAQGKPRGKAQGKGVAGQGSKRGRGGRRNHRRCDASRVDPCHRLRVLRLARGLIGDMAVTIHHGFEREVRFSRPCAQPI